MDFQYPSYFHAFKSYSYLLTKEEFDLYAGYQGKQIIQNIVEKHALSLDVMTVLATKQEFHKTRVDKPEPIDNVITLLKVFSEKYIVAVVSAGLRKNIKPIADTMNLPIHYMLTASEYDGLLKPDPGMYIKAMHDLNVIPEECLGFEDSIPGLEALKRAGIKAIDVRNFYEGRDENLCKM